MHSGQGSLPGCCFRCSMCLDSHSLLSCGTGKALVVLNQGHVYLLDKVGHWLPSSAVLQPHFFVAEGPSLSIGACAHHIAWRMSYAHSPHAGRPKIHCAPPFPWGTVHYCTKDSALLSPPASHKAGSFRPYQPPMHPPSHESGSLSSCAISHADLRQSSFAEVARPFLLVRLDHICTCLFANFSDMYGHMHNSYVHACTCTYVSGMFGYDRVHLHMCQVCSGHCVCACHQKPCTYRLHCFCAYHQRPCTYRLHCFCACHQRPCTYRLQEFTCDEALE